MKKTLLLLAIFSMAAVSCGGEKSKEAKLKAKKEELQTLRREIAELELDILKSKGDSSVQGKPVKIIPIKIGTFNHSIDIQGRVDADESIMVSPQMPGLVKRVYVQTGDHVSAGQVLAEIDASAAQQQMSALKAQRDLAQEVYNRQKNLWDQKIGTEVQYLQAKTQYEALDKQVSALQDQIDMAKLKAPMEGTVDAVNIKQGEIAAAGLSNIVLVNTDKMRVKGEVAEGYISQVETGKPVSIFFPDANKTIDTKISYSGKMINKINRTFNVEAVLPPNASGIVPNMVAVLKINDYSNENAIVVPLSAIQQTSDGKTFVFVAVKDKSGKLVADKRFITYTKTYNGTAEIKPGDGLNAGDQLITDGSADLNTGDVLSSK